MGRLTFETIVVQLFRVQHTEHDDPSTNYLIKHFVGESTDKYPAEILKIEPLAFGILPKAAHRFRDLIEELISEPHLLLFIPIPGRGQILLGLRPDDQQVPHERLRNRASTSDHGDPASGVASYAA